MSENANKDIRALAGIRWWLVILVMLGPAQTGVRVVVVGDLCNERAIAHSGVGNFCLAVDTMWAL